MGDCSLKRDNHHLRALFVSSWRTSMHHEQQQPAFFKDARIAAQWFGIDLQHDTPTKEQQWWKWRLEVRATCIHMLLSYTEQPPRETLTCMTCGAEVRGERSLKKYMFSSGVDTAAHEMQTASRLEAKTGTQGSERSKKLPRL